MMFEFREESQIHFWRFIEELARAEQICKE